VPRPPHWAQFINDEESAEDLNDLRARVDQNQPIDAAAPSVDGADGEAAADEPAPPGKPSRS
jgi:hypothetical protein